MSERWLLLSLLPTALANSEFPNDPYLAFRPPFARSLPVQIMLTGVVLTLVAVLFVHLLFTAQYHWPLAPVNYVLQLSGVTTLLISLIATIHVVLSATFAESEKWPYMLSYIAVNVPPLDVSTNEAEWSIAEKATWLVMNASTSGLIQITHIQFLTILYPSRLEGRLIFTLLGPLAVLAAVMQLLPISGSPSVYTVANSIRNVCNATLSLLFTLALFIWGLLVNRKQAWRTEGGTPVFGCAALSLAVISTALNFLYVHKQEEFVWLPSLMWAVVLWQSFLAWWWWVGAGAGGASAALAFASEDERLEEKLRWVAKKEKRRQEKREKKEEKKRKKAMKKQNDPSSSPDSSSPPRRRRSTDADAPSVTLTSGDSITSTSSLHSYLTTLPKLLPVILYRWYTSLRRAHNAAALVQAAEHVERMRELGREGVVVEAPQVVQTPGGGARSVRLDVEVDGWGWGWEGFGWRRRRRWRVSEPEPEEGKEKDKWKRRTMAKKEEEGHEMQDIRRPSRDADSEVDSEEEDMYLSETQDDARRRGSRPSSHPDAIQSPASSTSTLTSTTGNPGLSQPRTRRDLQPQRDQQAPINSPPEVQNPEAQAQPRLPQPPPRAAPAPPAQVPAGAARQRSVWWWGPLWRWRLQDSTVYR
ncbi:hypothetical protein CPB84DRAFT_1842040 [Gymnopilus junonius]|uniref:Uncharacterized protein n=1 Tax=Gymnopilus junonius TaxID=109634 RepID=A0A9P5NZ15_GYMJU|nr:hypothetical protein CPB84DRAFT_1842040 [Gymnopilus junonius]